MSKILFTRILELLISVTLTPVVVVVSLLSCSSQEIQWSHRQ